MERKPTTETARARFAALLAGHLVKGTRPASAAGEPWKYAEFAAEVPSSRVNNDFVSPGSVANWCKSKSLPTEINPILRALFGPISSGRHDLSREELREAFSAARAEKNAAVIARAKPDAAVGRRVPRNEQPVLDRTRRAHGKDRILDPLRQQLETATAQVSSSGSASELDVIIALSQIVDALRKITENTTYFEKVFREYVLPRKEREIDLEAIEPERMMYQIFRLCEAYDAKYAKGERFTYRDLLVNLNVMIFVITHISTHIRAVLSDFNPNNSFVRDICAQISDILWNLDTSIDDLYRVRAFIEGKDVTLIDPKLHEIMANSKLAILSLKNMLGVRTDVSTLKTELFCNEQARIKLDEMCNIMEEMNGYLVKTVSSAT